MDRCGYCGRPIDSGEGIARRGRAMHPRCVVVVLLREPRVSAVVTQRMVVDLIPMEVR